MTFCDRRTLRLRCGLSFASSGSCPSVRLCAWEAIRNSSMIGSRMNKQLAILAASLAVVGALVVTALPTTLQSLGLHPEFKGQRYLLPEGKALIIATSHDRLGEGGAETGVAASELTVPYYEFMGGRVEVDIASNRGG